MTVAEPGSRVEAAWQCLTRGDYLGVLEQLAEVPLAPPLRGRAWAWKGQALTELGRHEEAAGALMEAIREARRLGDHDDLVALRALLDRVRAVQAAEELGTREQARDRALAALSRQELLDGVAPGERVDRLLRQANVWIDLGRAEEAACNLEDALSEADALGELRARVLTRLCQLRLPAALRPASAELLLYTAWRLADEHDDTNLIAATASAARAAGLPTPAAPGF